jgi:transcriptional regulator with XRE-family HTH domain
MERRSRRISARQRLAANLRRLRRERGLSQEGLADRCGLHRTIVGAVERAERNISIDNIERLAIALDLDVAELLSPSPR